MKTWYSVLIIIGSVSLTFGVSQKIKADDTIKEIKAAPAKAASDIRDGITETGQIAVETGQKAKKKASETWSIIKKNTIEAGKSVKKGVQNIGKEFTKKPRGTSNPPAQDSNSEQTENTQ